MKILSDEMEVIFIESMFLQLLPYLQLEIDYTSSVQMVINYYNFTQLFEKLLMSVLSLVVISSNIYCRTKIMYSHKSCNT